MAKKLKIEAIKNAAVHAWNVVLGFFFLIWFVIFFFFLIWIVIFFFFLFGQISWNIGDLADYFFAFIFLITFSVLLTWFAHLDIVGQFKKSSYYSNFWEYNFYVLFFFLKILGFVLLTEVILAAGLINSFAAIFIFLLILYIIVRLLLLPLFELPNSGKAPREIKTVGLSKKSLKILEELGEDSLDLLEELSIFHKLTSEIEFYNRKLKLLETDVKKEEMSSYKAELKIREKNLNLGGVGGKFREDAEELIIRVREWNSSLKELESSIREEVDRLRSVRNSSSPARKLRKELGKRFWEI